MSCYLSFDPVKPPPLLLAKTLERARRNCANQRQTGIKHKNVIANKVATNKKTNNHYSNNIKGNGNKQFASQGELFSNKNVNSYIIQDTQLVDFYHNVQTKYLGNISSECEAYQAPIHKALPTTTVKYFYDDVFIPPQNKLRDDIISYRSIPLTKKHKLNLVKGILTTNGGKLLYNTFQNPCEAKY
jgi:hypothetical protein